MSAAVLISNTIVPAVAIPVSPLWSPDTSRDSCVVSSELRSTASPGGRKPASKKGSAARTALSRGMHALDGCALERSKQSRTQRKTWSSYRCKLLSRSEPGPARELSQISNVVKWGVRQRGQLAHLSVLGEPCRLIVGVPTNFLRSCGSH